MRNKFNSCVQGTRTTREFLREPRTLGNRLADIGEVQIRLKYWDGSNQYLRVEWAKAGLDPETSTLAELEVTAERVEMAEILRKGEDKRSTKTDGQSVSAEKSSKQSSKRKDRARRFYAKKEGNRKWKKYDRSNGSGNTDPSTRDKKSITRVKDGDVRARRERLTKAEKDELRAANKCFHCKQPGHLAKDCPDKETVRQSVGAISLPSIDSLRSSVNAMSLFFMSVPRPPRRLCRPLPVVPSPYGSG